MSHTIEWSFKSTIDVVCPSCGSMAAKPQVLQIRYDNHKSISQKLYRCEACESCFYWPMPLPAYETVYEVDGVDKFYVEQGAGIDVMLEALSLAGDHEAGRYLEVGCGFGFSLDYVAWAKGWEVRGYDPGSLARQGARELGLDIRSEYLLDDTLDGSEWGIILCSEVIEHLQDPRPFLLILTAALRTDGILVLTTPNADGVNPGTSSGALVPMLSAGLHTILFSARAIRALLIESGLPHVEVLASPHQLRILASRQVLPTKRVGLDRARYAAYLAARSEGREAGMPLGSGFMTRLLKEFVNTRRYEEAAPVLDRLRSGFLARYGFDIADPASIRMPVPHALPLLELGRAFPLNLTTVLFLAGQLKLIEGRDFGGAATLFQTTYGFARVLRSALSDIGGDDGETELFEAHAIVNEVSALRRTSLSDAVDRCQRLAGREADMGSVFSGLLAPVRAQVFVDLVNAGRYADAEALLPDTDPLAPPTAGLDDVGQQQSVAFAAGIVALNTGRYGPATRHFRCVYEACLRNPNIPHSRAIVWPALYHQGLALSRDTAADTARPRLRQIADELSRDHGPPWPAIPGEYRDWARQQTS